MGDAPEAVSYTHLELKNCLLKIIDEMALSSDIFNLSGKPAFCRKSKFNFSTLIQFILSFGSNSLGPVSYTHLTLSVAFNDNCAGGKRMPDTYDYITLMCRLKAAQTRKMCIRDRCVDCLFRHK